MAKGCSTNKQKVSQTDEYQNSNERIFLPQVPKLPHID